MSRVLLALLVAFTGPAAAQSGQVTVFTSVSVAPMDREEVLANQTVIVENGRITYVGAPRTAPPGAVSIDGRGKFLVPAIAEFHAHVPSGGQTVNAHRALTLYALAGVATARGMLGAPLHLALRDSIAKGLVLGPRLITSGPSFNNNSVTSPYAAMAMVRDQKTAGYDLLKIHPGVPRMAFDSLAATANRLGIPFAGHVPLEIGLDVALVSKYSTIDRSPRRVCRGDVHRVTAAHAAGEWILRAGHRQADRPVALRGDRTAREGVGRGDGPHTDPDGQLRERRDR